MSTIESRYETVRAALDALESSHRPALLAVSKTFPADDVLRVARLGQSSFGENYVQEGVEKIHWFKENHPELALTWHFIGPLQSNKTRAVAENFDWVQSIDRLKIAERLNAQRPDSMAPINVLIEVNIDGETTKSGVSPDQVRAMAQAISKLPQLKLRGLMTIPEPKDSHEEKLVSLRAMQVLYESLKEEFAFDTLSMGMTHDYIEAAQCGSTMVRVGTAIFGARDYSKK